MPVESAPASHRASPPVEIYAARFRQLRPRTPLPEVRVEFRRYANANAQVKWEDGMLLVRLADTLAGAPEDVLEALAEILLSKLFRRPVPPASNDRYRRYLNRRDVRRSLDLVRQIRGRKQVEHPAGPALRPGSDVRGAELSLLFRTDGAAAAGLEPECIAYSAGTLRSVAQCHRPEPDSGPRRTRRGWRSSMCCSTRCCTCAIRPSTAARAAACIPGRSRRPRNSSSG